MSTEWQYEFKDSRGRLKFLWESRVLADCSFLVGEGAQEMDGHKIIIGMASPMLLKKIEEEGGDRPQVAIADVEPDIFTFILKYIYTDSVEIMTSEMAFKLGEAARAFQLPHLEKECYNFITTSLTPLNALRGYELGLCTKDDELAKKCEEIIKTKTKEVLEDSSFQEACIDTVEAVFSLDKLEIDSEMELLKAIDRYVKHSKIESVADGWAGCDNNAVIRSVLKKIRFLTVTPEEFVKGRVGTSALSETDACAVLANIVSSGSGVPMPEGFSTIKDRRTKATVKFNFIVQDFANFAKITDNNKYSRHVVIRDLPWKFNVTFKTENSINYVACYLYCNWEDNSDWSCRAEVTMALLRSEIEPIKKTLTHVFSIKEHQKSCTYCYNRGFGDFVKLEDALNPENKYLQDGALIWEVSIKADKPIFNGSKAT